MKESNLEVTFREILAFWSNPNNRRPKKSKKMWSKMHDLAEGQFPPALDFFFDGLYEENWYWRETFLSLLGFHYEFPSDGRIAEKVRDMLLSDSSSQVRMTAAAVLGIRSSWPDHTLIAALEEDPQGEVRTVAFTSLLQLAGYSNLEAQNEAKRLREEETNLTLEELANSIRKVGLSCEELEI